MNKMRNLISALLGLMAGLAILIACQPREVDLPFETIERANFPHEEYYEGKDPKLVVITRAEQAGVLGSTVSLNAQVQLRDLDFDQYFVIAVFQGWRPSLPTPQSGVEVQRISKKEGTITIYTHFYEPVEGYEQKLVVISPYQLVKIPKGEDMQGEFEFVLNVDGTDVVKQTHLVP